MPIDDRKQRIMTAIVSLYSSAGEPVGSGLLSQHFNMAVSSATLRNEMAALTRLGLLEQPHTSAGRIPTTKGYRYYVDNLLTAQGNLPKADRRVLDAIFQGLDYDPVKMVQGAAKALAELLGYAVIATTPGADDLCIAHFEVLQVGQRSAAVLAVTAGGGVITRVAKVDFELADGDMAMVAKALNTHLRFVAAADLDTVKLHVLLSGLNPNGQRFLPLIRAAITLLTEAGRPNIYFEGQQHLLDWPELENSMHALLVTLSNPQQVEELLRPQQDRTAILFGSEIAAHPIPGLCLITRQYLAGGGLWGTVSVAGPSRMRYLDVIPKLEYFSELLGQYISGVA